MRDRCCNSCYLLFCFEEKKVKLDILDYTIDVQVNGFHQPNFPLLQSVIEIDRCPILESSY